MECVCVIVLIANEILMLMTLTKQSGRIQERGWIGRIGQLTGTGTTFAALSIFLVHYTPPTL